MLYGTLTTALGSSTLGFTAQWDPEQKQTRALGALLFLDLLPTSKRKEELYYVIESVYAAQANLGSTCSLGWASPAQLPECWHHTRYPLPPPEPGSDS